MFERVVAAARWLAPSFSAACVATLAVGAIEGYGLGARGMIASIGLTWCIAGPVLIAIAIAARGVFAAWQPAALASRLRDEHGAWPRLAGWVGVVWLATVGTAWGMFQAVWRLNAWTAFKPLTLSFATPLAASLAALLAIALARPAADVLARGAVIVDARWRRLLPGRRSLFTPWRITAVALATFVLVLWIAWHYFAAQRLGPQPRDLATVPAATLVALLVVHAAWPRLRHGPRAALALIATLAVAGALGTALHVLVARPVLALRIWSEQPIARATVERLRSLEAIRAAIPRARYQPVALAGVAHRDVLVISVGGVRADATPAYAGSADMPGLRALAQRGSVLGWAFTPSTAPGHALVDVMIGVEDGRVRGDPQLDPRHVLLADRLRAGGYETVAFACCGRDAGPRGRIGLARGLDHVVVGEDGAEVADAARSWLLARDRRGTTTPLFAWVHLDLPTVVPPPGAAAISSGTVADRDAQRRRRYESALTGLDASLRQVLEGFGERAPERAPIMVIVGDRGTSLGEHGVADGAAELYHGEARGPFLVVGPDVRVQEVQETVSTLDLVPTVLELAGFAVPLAELDGISLAQLLRGTRASSLLDGTAVIEMPGAAALVRGTWKLIARGGPPELYDVKSDAFEKTDQSDRRTTLVETLRDQLEAYRLATSKPRF